MLSTSLLAALALAAAFLWIFAGLVGYWKKGQGPNAFSQDSEQAAQYKQHAEYFYSRLSWPVRVVISIGALVLEQRYGVNRTGITLCFVTAFVQSMSVIRPGVVGNSRVGWTQWTQHGLCRTFGDRPIHGPISRSLTAAASRADRDFLLVALGEAILKKLSLQSDSHFIAKH